MEKEIVQSVAQQVVTPFTNHQFRKFFTSAVCLSPPPNLWPPIQAIRSKHDKSYVRWLPHINLLFPFIHNNEFEKVINVVKEEFKKFPPFKVRFAGFNYFHHGTLYLQPTAEPADALIKLQGILEQLFPGYNELSTKSPQGFTPHLSVGQFPKNQLKKFVDQFQATWAPIEFEVSEIYVISRDGDVPFKVRYVIPLGSDISPQHIKPEPEVFTRNNKQESTNEES